MKARALLTSVFSKAGILQTFLYCLSHFSSNVQTFYLCTLFPKAVSPFCPNYSLFPSLSELANNFSPWTTKSTVTFPPVWIIFLFQELPVTPLQSLPFAPVIPPCSLGMSHIVPQVLPLSPELLQPSPPLCPFFWQISLQIPFTFSSKLNNPVLVILSLNYRGPGYLSIVCSFFSQINRVKG